MPCQKALIVKPYLHALTIEQGPKAIFEFIVVVDMKRRPY